MKVSICLPTYNEAGNIVGVIHGVLKNFEKMQVEPEIIVVDDNSPDGTAQIVKNNFCNDSRIRCVIRTKKKGYALSVKRFIKESTGNHLLLMNADGNHNPDYIPIFLTLSPYYDAIGGSRFAWGGGMEGHQPRCWGSYYFNLIVRIVLWVKSRDNTSGFILFKKNMLEKLDLDKVFRGYGEYYFTMLYFFRRQGYSFAEIPVYYPMRMTGESKTEFFLNLLKYLKLILSIRLGIFDIYKK